MSEQELMIESDWFNQKCVELLENAIFESKIIYPPNELVINIPDYFLNAVEKNYTKEFCSISYEHRFMGIELRTGYENEIIIFHPSCVVRGKSSDNFYKKQIP